MLLQHSEGFSIEKTTHSDLTLNVSLDLGNPSTVLSQMSRFAQLKHCTSLHELLWLNLGFTEKNGLLGKNCDFSQRQIMAFLL